MVFVFKIFIPTFIITCLFVTILYLNFSRLNFKIFGNVTDNIFETTFINCILIYFLTFFFIINPNSLVMLLIISTVSQK